MTTALPPITDRSPAANMQSSRHFLEHATLELEKDPPERLQASEKSWGALSQAVKAVAKDRRWRNDSHFRTHAILNQIIYEQWDETATAEEVRRDFLAVQSLHSNYHENVSDVPTIEVGIKAAQRLVDRLEQVRRDGPRPAVIQDSDVQELLAYLLEINQLDQSVIDRVIPIGKRSDDGFKKDGMLGRVVSRVRRGREIPGPTPLRGECPGLATEVMPITVLIRMMMVGAAARRRGRDRVGNRPLAGSPGLCRKAGKRWRQTFG